MSSHNRVTVTPVDVDAILDLRDEYRREMACQIVHDSWHRRGFTQSYLLQSDDGVLGYGSVGGPPGEARNIVKECFVRHPFRGVALPLFRALVETSGAAVVEAQTNDRLLLLMLYDCAKEITTDTILFGDDTTTCHPVPPGVNLRRVGEDDHMEVAGPHRRQGFGSYLVQELKRICREEGRTPAARCHQDNAASRRTLQRAGMFPCGRIVRGRLTR